MPTVSTACPLDCPDACSLEVQVADGRVVKLDGDHRNPITAGFICTKVRHLPQHLYGPYRLLHPAVREGVKGEARFRRASWDEALGLVAERIRAARAAHGAESILPFYYGGSNGALTQNTTDARFFRRLGASRLERTVCAAATTRATQALYGRMPGIAYPDYAEAQLIVLWGANPSSSGIHLVPWIQEAQRRGAKLAVIDPRRVPLAKKADLHLALRPGTDLPVALALIRWLFEHGKADLGFLDRHATGAEELARRAERWTIERAARVAEVPAADLERLAELYAESSPALVRCGWGLERNRNGGSAVAAVLALPAVGGKFGVRGGGYTLSNSSYWNLDTGAAVDAQPPATRLVNMNHLGRALAASEPPVELLFVYNANPLATIPNQQAVRAGLEREDLFTVVFDAVMTDTARYADVVLPATTFLEHSDLSRGYGSVVLQTVEPVVPPVGEARSNFDVFLELCDRLDLSRPGDARTPAEFTAAALAAHGDAERLAAELEEHGISRPANDRPVQMVDVLPRTADAKVQLVPDDVDAETPGGMYTFRDDPATAAFPLALISPASSKTISSTLGQLDRKPAALELNPHDAAARGIANGDRVRVWNELGEVHCAARLSADLKPGVVLLPKGLWSHHTANGATSNTLCPDTLTDFAGGACFNDARVEVEGLEIRG